MENKTELIFLDSIQHRFKTIKSLGEKAIRQLSDPDINWQPNSEANSIAIIIQHLHGNMLSRWTDFLIADGEKETRDRDGEFACSSSHQREDLLKCGMTAGNACSIHWIH